jgi:hypothetical protein
MYVHVRIYVCGGVLGFFPWSGKSNSEPDQKEEMPLALSYVNQLFKSE